MAILRTPERCFTGLPDFGFEPRYLELASAPEGPLRMAYLDEGPRDAPIVLMLHGEPTWSFLYRKVIPPIVAAGYRAIAPDHMGFGRSDKLADRHAYTVQRFVDWLADFVGRLDLRAVTLLAQDWGGPIGLRVLSQMPDRFDAIVVANTLLPNCEPPPRGIVGWPGPGITAWAETARNAADLPVGEIVAGVCASRPPPEIIRGYDAPFPDASYKAAVLQFPPLIPLGEEAPGIAENRAAWQVLETWRKPLLTAFSDRDPSTKLWEAVFRHRVPGAAGQPHVEIGEAGHFLQEEQGETLGRVVATMLDRLYEGRS